MSIIAKLPVNLQQFFDAATSANCQIIPWGGHGKYLVSVGQLSLKISFVNDEYVRVVYYDIYNVHYTRLINRLVDLLGLERRHIQYE